MPRSIGTRPCGRNRSAWVSIATSSQNFLKEIFFDSDTTIGLLSGAPFDDPSHWFLTNDQIKQASETVNGIAGSRRLLFHSVITPKQPGWMDEVDRVIEHSQADELERLYDRRPAIAANHEISVAARR